MAGLIAGRAAVQLKSITEALINRLKNNKLTALATVIGKGE